MNRWTKVTAIILTGMFVSVAAGVSRAAISADELAKIVKAVPKKATVKPKKPRRMLVFAKGKGHVHTAIPYGTKALGLMAEKTGAFEIVVTTDMAVFRPEVLKSFDAICFNNSNRMDFSDPAKRKAVMERSFSSARSSDPTPGSAGRASLSETGASANFARLTSGPPPVAAAARLCPYRPRRNSIMICG